MAAVQTPGTTAAPAAVSTPAGQETTTATTGAKGEDTTPKPDDAPLANLAEKQKAYRKEKKAKEAAPAAAEAAEAATETPKTEGEKPKGDVTAEQLFAPEALATPEGISKAREILLYTKGELEKGWRKFDRADMRVKERDKAVATREEGCDRRETAIKTVWNTLNQGLQILRGQRDSNPIEVLRTLDMLAGGKGDHEAGRQLAHDIMMTIGRDGKPVAESESEKRLRLEFEQLKAERERERRQHSEAEIDHRIQVAEQKVAQRELQIGNHAISSGEYPGIAGFASQGGTNAAAVGNWVANLMKQAYDSGEPLDLAEAIGILDRKLAPYGQRAAQAEHVGDQTEQVESAKPQAKQGARQVTVLPSDADRSSGVSRKETPEERRARQARDPELLKRLGPVIANAAGLR